MRSLPQPSPRMLAAGPPSCRTTRITHTASPASAAQPLLPLALLLRKRRENFEVGIGSAVLRLRSRTGTSGSRAISGVASPLAPNGSAAAGEDALVGEDEENQDQGSLGATMFYNNQGGDGNAPEVLRQERVNLRRTLARLHKAALNSEKDLAFDNVEQFLQFLQFSLSHAVRKRKTVVEKLRLLEEERANAETLGEGAGLGAAQLQNDEAAGQQLQEQFRRLEHDLHEVRSDFAFVSARVASLLSSAGSAADLVTFLGGSGASLEGDSALVILDWIVKAQNHGFDFNRGERGTSRTSDVLRFLLARIEEDFFTSDLRVVNKVCAATFNISGSEVDDAQREQRVVVDQLTLKCLIDHPSLLPLQHKVQLLTCPRGTSSSSCSSRGASSSSSTLDGLKRDVAMQWKRLDPVDMEAWEKTRFEECENKVPRQSYVRALDSAAAETGRKLKMHLALQLYERACRGMFAPNVPRGHSRGTYLGRGGKGAAGGMTLKDIALAAHPFCLAERVQRGDLQRDVQEALCRELLSRKTEALLPYVFLLTSGFSNVCSCESAFLLWRKKLLPAISKLLSLRNPAILLAGQEGVEKVEVTSWSAADADNVYGRCSSFLPRGADRAEGAPQGESETQEDHPPVQLDDTVYARKVREECTTWLRANAAASGGRGRRSASGKMSTSALGRGRRAADVQLLYRVPELTTVLRTLRSEQCGSNSNRSSEKSSGNEVEELPELLAEVLLTQFQFAAAANIKNASNSEEHLHPPLAAIAEVRDFRENGATPFQLAQLLDEFNLFTPASKSRRAAGLLTAALNRTSLSAEEDNSKDWILTSGARSAFGVRSQRAAAWPSSSMAMILHLPHHNQEVYRAIARRHARLFVDLCRAPFVELDSEFLRKLVTPMRNVMAMRLRRNVVEEERCSRMETLFSAREIAQLFDACDNTYADGEFLSLLGRCFVADEDETTSTLDLALIAHGLGEAVQLLEIEKEAHDDHRQLGPDEQRRSNIRHLEDELSTLRRGLVERCWERLKGCLEGLAPNLRLMLINAVVKTGELGEDVDFRQAIETYVVAERDADLIPAIGAL